MRLRPDSPIETEDDECCHICSCRVPLSFEHIPPKSMGNSEHAELLDMLQAIAKLDGRDPGRGQISQRGSGSYSLCRRCNERAGALYVPELAKWGQAGMSMLGELDLEALDDRLEPAYVDVELRDVCPGRLLKQVVTMLLATAGGGFALHPRHVDLRDFAQDPEWVSLPERYQFYMVLYTGEFARMNGGSASLELHEGSWGTTFVLEVATPPFAFVMSVDEAKPAVETGNISRFADVGIRDKGNVSMQLRVGFGHTPFPCDFRTKAALEKCRIDSLRNSAARRLWTPPGSATLRS